MSLAPRSAIELAIDARDAVAARGLRAGDDPEPEHPEHLRPRVGVVPSSSPS